MRTPENQATAQILTDSPLYGRQVNSVAIESNRATNPLSSHSYYWQLALVRRGNPISQLVVNLSWVALNSAISFSLAAFGLYPLLTYFAVLLLLVILGGVATMQDSRLTRHGIVLLVLTIAGVTIGLL